MTWHPLQLSSSAATLSSWPVSPPVCLLTQPLPFPFPFPAHSTPAPGMTNSFSSSGPQRVVTSSENTSLIALSIRTRSLDSVTIASAHLFPSEPFSQSQGSCFVLLLAHLAIVCAVRWNVQLCEAGTSDLAFLMAVSLANDPS